MSNLNKKATKAAAVTWTTADTPSWKPLGSALREPATSLPKMKACSCSWM